MVPKDINIFFELLQTLSLNNFYVFVTGLPGAKIVFWDMRDSFLFYLYHGGVEGNRIDGVLPEFDRVRYLVLLFSFCGSLSEYELLMHTHILGIDRYVSSHSITCKTIITSNSLLTIVLLDIFTVYS